MREAGVERIAVLRANAVGDFLFCVPALDALRAAYPRAEITLLARPWHADFLAGRPGPVDRVVVVPPAHGVRDEPGVTENPAGLERFFRRMRAERFDLALQMHGGGRWSNPFVRRLGARVTAGSRAAETAPLDRWIPYVYFQPEIARWLEIAGLVGASPVTLSPSVTVVPRDVEEAAPLTAPGPFAVLHPGAGAPRRRWAPEHFAEVGDALAAQRLRVIVTGTGGERRIVDAVCEAMRAPAERACDALSLGGLAGLLARAAVVVSNDSGPLHLAAAVGAPTVGIFWVGNLVNGAPLTRAAHRPVASFRVDCPVCGRRNVETSCEHDASFVDDAPVGEVVDAALELLGGVARGERLAG
ncbi:MAG: glycosyl transferase [Conexibacter sp.]|nr:glycosyl transferase [Conexibacter sp.]